MIATYALHGFANLAGIGIQLGFLGGLCPEKKHVISEVVLRALIGGSISCWMTACVAGMFDLSIQESISALIYPR